MIRITRGPCAKVGGCLPKCSPPRPSCPKFIFLTQDIPEAKDRIEGWLADGRLELPFTVRDHHSLIHELMALARYANVPMSFADACLVRMSELWPDAPVFTLDSDFRVYRRNKRQSLPLICL